MNNFNKLFWFNIIILTLGYYLNKIPEQLAVFCILILCAIYYYYTRNFYEGLTNILT